MNSSFWIKQSTDKPVYDDLLWSRPEHKSRAGKLLIVGGNSNGFSSPAAAYNLAAKAKIGNLKVLLPDSLKTSIGKHLEEATYCPSNRSGSFSKQALAEMLDHSSWADLVLLSGDFGHNSETAILLETFIDKYSGPLSLTNDSLDSFLVNPKGLFERSDTLIVTDVAKLQKLIQGTSSSKPLTSTLSLIQAVELLAEITKLHPAGIITSHLDHVIFALKGQVSSTNINEMISDWQLELATYASVWWLQNRTRPFEAITTSIYDALSS